MKPSIAPHVHRDVILCIVEAHRARNARMFGSIALGCAMEESDLDLLADPIRLEQGVYA